MNSNRIAWTARWSMILAVAAFPAVASAQQPVRTGDPNQPPPDQAALVFEEVASPATFGTSYTTLIGIDFTPFYTGVYETAGSGIGRYAVSGGTFYTATVELPDGVTVTEIEYYVIDNNAANASFFVYRGAPGTNTYSYLAGGGTSGASSAVVTYPVSITPYVVDATTQRLSLGITLQVAGSSMQIVGARVGYTGAPGQLILFPAPDRFVDTRDGRGGKGTKYANGEAFDHAITGVAGLDGNIIPVGAKAILGNVVAVNSTQGGLFKILPGGTATSIGRASVNFNAGFNTGNAFTVRLDSLGRIRGYHVSGGTTDLIVDVVGYYK